MLVTMLFLITTAQICENGYWDLKWDGFGKLLSIAKFRACDYEDEDNFPLFMGDCLVGFTIHADHLNLTVVKAAPNVPHSFKPLLRLDQGVIW
jgi:hypothetical protein